MNTTGYPITLNQASYLTELATAASRHRSGLESIKRYAERELASMDAGQVNGGKYFQLIGELHTDKQALDTLARTGMYLFGPEEQELKADLMFKAITGAETFFMPERLDN